MNEDTLRRFGNVLKLYSEQFELICDNDSIREKLVDGLTFMEDYPLMMKEVVDNFLR